MTPSSLLLPGSAPPNAAERIIEAATDIFARMPADPVTLSLIAKEADVKVPLLIYHFKSKSHLYQVVFDRAVSWHEHAIRPYLEMWEEEKALTKEQAAGILCMMINKAMDGLYCTSSPDPRLERILIFEMLYPSEFHDGFYEKYFQRVYEFFAAVIMAMTGNEDRETVFLQLATIIGLVVGFRAEREILVRSAGMTGFSLEEVEIMKTIVLRNVFLILKSDLFDKYFGELRDPGSFDAGSPEPPLPPPKPEPDENDHEPDYSIESVEQIIKASIRLFATQTADAVSLSMIAKEADVKIPLIMYHFKSKANLYRVAFERVMSFHDDIFRRYHEQWKREGTFSVEEAKKIFDELFSLFMGGLYLSEEPLPYWENMLVHEIINPSQSFDRFYRDFLYDAHELLVILVMTMSGNRNRQCAFLQVTSIFGLGICFRLTQKLLARSIGMVDFSREDVEKLKNTVLQNVFLLLETR